MEEKKIHDISMRLFEGMLCYPGDPKLKIEQVQSMDKGAKCNLSRLTMSSHAGTHIDPPYHFVNSGIRSDQVPLELLVGNARVIEVQHGGAIAGEDLLNVGIQWSKRLLIRTPNSRIWTSDNRFREDHAYLDLSAAEAIIDAGVQLVGFDYISVERYGAREARVHRRLLGAGVIILEGLNLSAIEPGDYRLICLPLAFIGLDGAPARAVLEDL